MHIETKFDIGQIVYLIRSHYARRIVYCTLCERTGEVTISGEKFICPKCHGRSKHEQSAGERWYLSDISEIGSIRFEQELSNPPEIKYMVSSTGIGSGTLWEEKDVFPTKEEAIAECDKRNCGRTFADEVQ